MTLVPEHELEPEPLFYLLQYRVIKKNSLTTKLRVVFNGSCRVKRRVSLNEALHSGPKLQNDLFDILLWIRQFRYIFLLTWRKCTDKFRSILLIGDFSVFFGRSVIKYQITTVTYGLTCLTIPRLELSADVLLTKLVVKCVKILNLWSVPCIQWTDVSIVHTWLNNHPS